MLMETRVMPEIKNLWNKFLMLWCVWCDIPFLLHDEGSMIIFWLIGENFSFDLLEILGYELHDDMGVCKGEGNFSLNITKHGDAMYVLDGIMYKR